MNDILRNAARRELKRREWMSKRGKATRAYLRDRPELAKQFEREGTVDIDFKGILPEHVTRASIVLELNQRAKRREASRAAKAWVKEHPEEAAKVAKEIKGED